MRVSMSRAIAPNDVHGGFLFRRTVCGPLRSPLLHETGRRVQYDSRPVPVGPHGGGRESKSRGRNGNTGHIAGSSPRKRVFAVVQ